jgi:cystathionine beta-synthase
VGGSSGMALYAGMQYAKKLTDQDIMVIIFPDSGKNYLAKLDEKWMKENGFFR